jgi:hypothetical protein
LAATQDWPIPAASYLRAGARIHSRPHRGKSHADEFTSDLGQISMDQLQLSQQLIDSVQDALMAADERARDPLVAMQYMSAIIGYALGKVNMATADKQDALEQLSALTRYVMEDVQRQQQARAPAGEVFGIWRPGDP